MKKLLGAIALTALVATMAPAHADDNTIELPMPQSEGARCTAEAAPGVFGREFAVTGGASFSLESLTDDGSVNDFDIRFYRSKTSCEAGADLPPEGERHLNDFGNEAGTVPASATIAVVYMYTGLQGAFSYTEA